MRGDKASVFNGVTNYGAVWRKVGAEKRGWERARVRKPEQLAGAESLLSLTGQIVADTARFFPPSCAELGTACSCDPVIEIY